MLAVRDEAAGNAAVEDETDAGPANGRAAPSRLCIASRTVRPVDELLRVVVGPDGALVPDLAARLPGRGAWVTATRAAVEEAMKKKAFGRAFKGRAKAPDADFPVLVETLLEKDALGALAFANKAGALVCGNAKVVEALQSGQVAVLMHASDAAPDGAAKLDGLARRIESGTGRGIARVSSLAGAQLDLALGRANVVHAALLAHGTSAGFLSRTRRLERWRAG